MSFIKKHNKLTFLNINIQYGDEKITLNLLSELRINPDQINDEIKRQPSKYGFLLLLHKKLLTRFEEIKTERKKVYGKLYMRAKETKQASTGRPMSDDLAKAWVESHKKYVDITMLCIKAKDDADTIFSCVRAFEQKKDLIQSLSSNIRNEKG